MARVKNPADGLYTGVLSKVDAVTLAIHEEQSGEEIQAPTAVNPADMFFDALQTSDARWTRDDIGYNVRYQVEPDQLPKGGRTYRFEFLITAVGTGNVHPLVFRQPTEQLYSA